MSGKICDVCGKDDLELAGVASSGLGAVSFAFCPICLAIGAEPKFMVEGTIEICNGVENISKEVRLIYYDAEMDSYIDVREGHILIKLKGGITFKKRNEMVKYIRRNKSW